jgi:hypothetical protein
LQGNSPFLVSLYSTEFRVVARGVRGLTYRGGTTESSVTTGLNADGSFEFPKVTRGHYILSVGIPGFAVYQSIEVTDKDLDGLELVIPRRKTVAGQMHVEAGGLLPRSYGFTLNRNDGSGLLVMLTPGCNGAFLAGLPEGEYRVSSRLPSGYVTSFAYGSQNLLRDSLRISPDDDAELRITFAVNTTAGVGIVGGEFFGGVNFSGLENATQGPTPAVPQRGASSSDMLINGCVFIAVERSVPVPANLSLTFTGASKVKVPVMPDGAFHTSLPKGQFRVALDGLPRGYTLKSINEDSTDLRREALRLNDPHTFVLVVLEAR